MFRAALLHAQGNAKGALADLLKVLEVCSLLNACLCVASHGWMTI